MRLAFWRLRYPVELTPRAEGQYLSYLRAHAGEAAVWLVGERDMPGLAFLLRTAEPDREALSAACALAGERGLRGPGPAAGTAAGCGPPGAGQDF